MTAKTPASIASARKKLLERISGAQKQADTAKRAAKTAKLGAQHAKEKFKAAKRAAKKLRKTVKTLRKELAGLTAKKPARKTAAKSTRRPKPAPVVLPSSDIVPLISADSAPAPAPVENPPAGQ